MTQLELLTDSRLKTAELLEALKLKLASSEGIARNELAMKSEQLELQLTGINNQLFDLEKKYG